MNSIRWPWAPKKGSKTQCPKFKQQSTITSKRYEIWCQLLSFISRKSHTVFPLVPTSVTLNDLERRNSLYFALFHPIRQLCRPIKSQWLKIDLYCLQNIVFHFSENWPTLQRGLSAIAELLVRFALTKALDTSVRTCISVLQYNYTCKLPVLSNFLLTCSVFPVL